MARTELNKGDVEVDLDTDGIKSQDINVEPVKNETESKEVNLQKEQVEQEGAEINRDKTPINVETEKDSDGFDLNKASDSVQKRINKLTRDRREADRRAEAALQYAQGLKSEISKFQSKYPKMEANYLSEFEKRLQTDEVAANTLLQKAIEGIKMQNQLLMQIKN